MKPCFSLPVSTKHPKESISKRLCLGIFGRLVLPLLGKLYGTPPNFRE